MGKKSRRNPGMFKSKGLAGNGGKNSQLLKFIISKNSQFQKFIISENFQFQKFIIPKIHHFRNSQFQKKPPLPKFPTPKTPLNSQFLKLAAPKKQNSRLLNFYGEDLWSRKNPKKSWKNPEFCNSEPGLLELLIPNKFQAEFPHQKSGKPKPRV